MSINPVQRRLDSLTENWVNDIPAKFLWTIDFQSRGGSGSLLTVASSIARVLEEYEGRRWSLNGDLFTNRTDDNIGFLFAQTIALPPEQLAVGTLPVENSGGFVAGYYSGRRTDYGGNNKLDITFLDQNKDVIDLFIRPWLVATSYYGLIEDNEVDLKCNIMVNLHSRNPSGFEERGIPFGSFGNLRKSYMFEDCVPINVEGEQLSYNEMTQGDLMKTASFAFAKYKLL